MKAKERDRALTLILEGCTLKEAAIAVGVSKGTVERWSAQYQWQQRKREHLNSLVEVCVHQVFEKSRVRTLKALDQVAGMFYQAAAERQLWYEGKIQKKDMVYTTKDFVQLGRAYTSMESDMIKRMSQS